MQANDLDTSSGAQGERPEDTTALPKPTRAPHVPVAGSPRPRPLNGYTLTYQFRKLRSRWDFTHLEGYLFFELIALATEEGWPAKFSAKNSALTAALGCSEKGLIKARKTLVEAGLLTYTEGQNRRPTSYRFCLSKGLPEVSIESVPSAAEGLPEDLPEVSVSPKHLPEGLPKDLPQVSPYKEVIKIKINPSGGVGVEAAVLPSTEQVSEQSADAPSAVVGTPLATTTAPDPGISPTRQPRRKKPVATVPELGALVLPHSSLEFTQLWADFLTSPKQVKKTPTALRLMLKKLGKYPEGFAKQMLEKAIMADWQGVEYDSTKADYDAWKLEQAHQPPSAATSKDLDAEALNLQAVAEQEETAKKKLADHLARYATPAEPITPKS